jgi:hypothetical protein
MDKNNRHTRQPSFRLSVNSQQHFSLRTNQPPAISQASSTFLSEQTSHQQSASSSFLSQQISTSHQPPTKRTGCVLLASASIS